MVFDKVKELIAEQLDVKADDITETSNIQDDLGADSLDVVDLVMALEDEFDVEIPEDQVENIKTEKDLKDAHISICRAYSAYRISYEQFMELLFDEDEE